MARRPKQRRSEDPATDIAVLEKSDWDAVDEESFADDREPADADLPYYVEVDGEAVAAGEHEDDVYQNSDEVLPDDGEERVLARSRFRGRSRFNGV